MSESKSGFWTYFLAFIVFLGLVVLFILSLGLIETEEVVSSPDFRDKKEEAKRKHKWYTEVLKNQKKLKTELDFKFKWIYLGVRFLLLASWAALIGLTYRLDWADNFLELFGIASLPMWFISAANYLASGTYVDLRDFIEISKIKTENWVYGKFIDLDEKIEKNEKVIVKLENEITQMR